MLLKLVFSGATAYQGMLQTLSTVINDSTCTTITAVQNLSANASTGQWGNNTIDTTNSFIYRTATSGNGLLTTAKTKSFFTKLGNTAGNNTFMFGIEQSVYDNNSHKIIHLIYNSTATTSNNGANMLHNITTTSRNSVTYSGLFDAPLIANSFYVPTTPIGLQTQVSPNTGATRNITMAGGGGGGYSNVASNNSQYSTMFAFVTDNCFYLQFFISATPTNAGKGIPIGSTINGYSTRPIMNWQYTRTDPWNNAANSIFPAIFNNGLASNTPFCGQVFVDSAVLNADIGNSAFNSLRAFTSIDAKPSTTATSWPLIYDMPITLGIGNYYTDHNASGQNQGGYRSFNDAYQNVTQPGGYHFGPGIQTTASNSRWYSDNISTAGYALLPLSWRNNFYFNSGGHISNKTGIYMFNGNFWPGDNITTATSKNYYLLPAPLLDNNQQLALAFPKE